MRFRQCGRCGEPYELPRGGGRCPTCTHPAAERADDKTRVLYRPSIPAEYAGAERR